MKTLSRISLIALMVMVFIWPHLSDTPEFRSRHQNERVTQSRSNAMVVSIDPKTRKLRSDLAVPKELRQQIREMTQFSTKGLKVKKLADGSEELELQGRFQNFTVAVLDSNNARITCYSTAEPDENRKTEGHKK